MIGYNERIGMFIIILYYVTLNGQIQRIILEYSLNTIIPFWYELQKHLRD